MKPLLRVIDANLNRSREGLRVCEDFARFVMNDLDHSNQFKKIRHQLSVAALRLPYDMKVLVGSRDSVRDVGKTGYIRDERDPSWHSLMKANFKRVEESLRVLEECSKIAAPKSVRLFQKIRFEVYELEKKVITKL